MDAMLHALGGILLRAVPTFILILLLHQYLKLMFFKPMEKVLHARYEATEGARKLAEESLAAAAAKTAQYEKALFEARTEIYAAQEGALKAAQEEHDIAVKQARAEAESQIKQARAALAAEVADVRAKLSSDSDALANRIADTILRRSVA